MPIAALKTARKNRRLAADFWGRANREVENDKITAHAVGGAVHA